MAKPRRVIWLIDFCPVYRMWLAFRTFVRRRMDLGVTSTISSWRTNSMACSRLKDTRRRQADCLVCRRRAHVGELLLFGDVDVQVGIAGVFAHDHHFVNLGTRPDENLDTLR